MPELAGGQQLQMQPVLLQQMVKVQDGAFVGQMVCAHIQPGKLAKHRQVIQRLFHRRVR